MKPRKKRMMRMFSDLIVLLIILFVAYILFNMDSDITFTKENDTSKTTYQIDIIKGSVKYSKTEEIKDGKEND